MACIDELLETMEAVRALLENRKDCCDDNVSYGIQDEVDTEIDPGVGDPPDYYGETAIADWDDWVEHVCYNAHLYVDNLKNMGAQLGGAVEQNSLYLGLIAAGLVLLTFSGVGLPVAYLLASFVVTGLVLAATVATFEDTAEELETAREDIVCALVQGGDLATEVENAIGSSAWDLFYQFVDYDSATAIIHEGGANGEYLPEETDDSCTCEELEEGQLIHNPNLTLSLARWTIASPFTWAAEQVNAGDEVPTYEYFRSDNWVPVSSGYYKLEMRQTGYSNPTRDSTWYVKVYRASDDLLIDTFWQVCNSKDGQFHEKIHAKITVVPGEVYYCKVAFLTNYANSYAITNIEGWESVS